MVLPLYFAIFSKEFLKYPENAHPIAATGCTFDPAGGRIIRENTFSADMLVVDDQVLPENGAAESCAHSLLQLLEQSGAASVMFDFERPVNAFCTQFLSELAGQLPQQMIQIVPPAYTAILPPALALASGSPCNSWRNFCAKQQKAYGQRWCLELVPWNYRVGQNVRTRCTGRQISQLNFTAKCRNANALCVTGRTENANYLFDTADTLTEKLQVAQQYGCQLAVGLYDELEPYFPAE